MSTALEIIVIIAIVAPLGFGLLFLAGWAGERAADKDFLDICKSGLADEETCERIVREA